MTSHARNSDPDTSHDTAASINMNRQRHRVLRTYYRHRPPDGMIDHEAYVRAGITVSGWTHQRCSDLRQAGWIARTGSKGITPSNKPAHRCAITPEGILAFESWAMIYGW